MGHFNGKIGNAHAPCHVTGGRGHPKPHIWNQRPQFAYSLYNFYGATQCLKWSKKEAGSLPQAEVECPLPRIYLFIFDLKMASSDAFLVVFYAI